MTRKTKKSNTKTLRTLSKKELLHILYPLVAGIPTAILILYFFDLGAVYRDILTNFISPIITGIVSGFVLYMLGIKR